VIISEFLERTGLEFAGVYGRGWPDGSGGTPSAFGYDDGSGETVVQDFEYE
jgi:hypothetical protein